MQKLSDEYYEPDFSGLTFYHGTSDIFQISRILPSSETGVLREDWRKKYRDKVFFTSSVISAKQFAKKACEKYGGNPVVYIVNPTGDIQYVRANEFVADSAVIVRRAE